MEFGIFLEFPVREGGTDKEAFDDSLLMRLKNKEWTRSGWLSTTSARAA